jgi:hypothetical protein
MMSFEKVDAVIDSETDVFIDTLEEAAGNAVHTLQEAFVKIVRVQSLEFGINILKDMIDTLDTPEEVLAELEKQLYMLKPPLDPHYENGVST